MRSLLALPAPATKLPGLQRVHGAQLFAPAADHVLGAHAEQEVAFEVALNVPAAHVLQARSFVAEPAVEAKLPGLQLVHGAQLFAPAADHVLGAHAEQEVAFELALKVPAAHSAHEASPELALNVPGAHAEHDVAFELALNVPAAHSVHEAAPELALNVPGAHAEHDVAFELALNVPAPQSVQTRSLVAVPAVDTNRPGAQVVQAVQLVAPAADQVPGAQAVQAAAPVPSAEKVPAGQALQA